MTVYIIAVGFIQVALLSANNNVEWEQPFIFHVGHSRLFSLFDYQTEHNQFSPVLGQNWYFFTIPFFFNFAVAKPHNRLPNFPS
jgi:hypothetical protein